MKIRGGELGDKNGESVLLDVRPAPPLTPPPLAPLFPPPAKKGDYSSQALIKDGFGRGNALTDRFRGKADRN